MMYNGERSGVARQVKGEKPRPYDERRSGSSGDSVKPEKQVAGKKERVRLVQVDGKIKLVPVD